MAAPQTQKNDGAIDAEWRRKEDGEIGELEGTGVGGRKGKGKREELCDAGDDGEREGKGGGEASVAVTVLMRRVMVILGKEGGWWVDMWVLGKGRKRT